MLMNSLDPAVAEHPADLIVSGGIGKLARDWPAFRAIADSLRQIENDETLIVHSGEPGPILKTKPDFPRAVILNSHSSRSAKEPHSGETNRPASPHATRIAADWMFTGPSSELPEAYETFRAAARRHFGGNLAGRLVVAGGMGGMGGAQALAATLNCAAFLGIDADSERIKRRVKAGFCEVMVNDLDEALRILKNAVRKRDPASVGLIANASELLPELARRGVLPDLLTDQTPADDPLTYIPQGLAIAQAAELREKDPRAYRERAFDSIAAQVHGMLELKKLGSVVFEFGNGIRAQAHARGVAGAYDIPEFAAQYRQPDLEQDRGLLTIVVLSGDPDDLARVDSLFPMLFPDSELEKWIAIARKHHSGGFPARSCWIGPREAIHLGIAVNELIARGEIKAPVAMGRALRRNRAVNSPDTSPARASDPTAFADPSLDSPGLPALLASAAGAAWLSLEELERPGGALEQRSGVALLADGQSKAAERIERIFAGDFAT